MSQVTWENYEQRVQSRQYTTSLPGAQEGEYFFSMKNRILEKKLATETIIPMKDQDGE
jgi:hypothetical protein